VFWNDRIKSTSPDANSYVTKGNVILAYEEIFQLWKVELSLEQQKRVKDIYFKQAWGRFANKEGNLNVKDSFRFVMELMTTQ